MTPIKTFEGCLNKNDMVTDEIDKTKMKTDEHIKGCIKLYRMQAERGAYSLHENLETAESWNCRHVKELCGDLVVEKFKYFGIVFA